MPNIKTNIANLRSHLRQCLAKVEKGEILEIQRRNITIARVIPVKPDINNKTKLGCGKGTASISGDLTEPAITEWEMIKN